MRVMSVALAMSASRPLCPQERCYSGHAGTGAQGQQRLCSGIGMWSKSDPDRNMHML